MYKLMMWYGLFLASRILIYQAKEQHFCFMWIAVRWKFQVEGLHTGSCQLL